MLFPIPGRSWSTLSSRNPECCLFLYTPSFPQGHHTCKISSFPGNWKLMYVCSFNIANSVNPHNGVTCTVSLYSLQVADGGLTITRYPSPFEDRIYLARLRCGHHPTLQAYQNRLDESVPDTCTDWTLAPHTMERGDEKRVYWGRLSYRVTYCECFIT